MNDKVKEGFQILGAILALFAVIAVIDQLFL